MKASHCPTCGRGAFVGIHTIPPGGFFCLQGETWIKGARPGGEQWHYYQEAGAGYPAISLKTGELIKVRFDSQVEAQVFSIDIEYPR